MEILKLISYFSGLTIKHTKNQKPKPEIPNKPMFYDSEDDDIDSNINFKQKINAKKRWSSLNDLSIPIPPIIIQINNDIISSCPELH